MSDKQSVDLQRWPDLESLLKHTTVKDITGPLPADREWVWVNEDDSVNKALEALKAKQILSVPVYSSKMKEYVAFLDIVDIVCYALKMVEDNALAKDKNKLRIKEIIETEAKFQNTTCGQVASSSYLKKEFTILRTAKDTDLASVIEKMAKWHNERLPIITKKNKFGIGGILTQSKVIEWLVPRLSDISESLGTVGEMKLGYKDSVFQIKKTDTVRKGFETIRDSRVRGVLVTDKNGKGIGNLSASDFRALEYNMDLLSDLDMTVEELLCKNSTDGKMRELVCVSPSDSFEDVGRKFRDAHVHRLFVDKGKGEIIGVISLTDYLAAISKTVLKS